MQEKIYAKEIEKTKTILLKPLESMDILDDFLLNAMASNPTIGKDFCRTLPA